MASTSKIEDRVCAYFGGQLSDGEVFGYENDLATNRRLRIEHGLHEMQVAAMKKRLKKLDVTHRPAPVVRLAPRFLMANAAAVMALAMFFNLWPTAEKPVKPTGPVAAKTEQEKPATAEQTPAETAAAKPDKPVKSPKNEAKKAQKAENKPADLFAQLVEQNAYHRKLRQAPTLGSPAAAPVGSLSDEERAVLFYENKNWDSLLDWTELALRADPARRLALDLRHRALMESGRFAEAVGPLVELRRLAAEPGSRFTKSQKAELAEHLLICHAFGLPASRAEFDALATEVGPVFREKLDKIFIENHH